MVVFRGRHRDEQSGYCRQEGLPAMAIDVRLPTLSDNAPREWSPQHQDTGREGEKRQRRRTNREVGPEGDGDSAPASALGDEQVGNRATRVKLPASVAAIATTSHAVCGSAS
jgi:hypothetical protein